MYTFDYTKDYNVDSSWVDAVTHNENNNEVLVDTGEEFYLYTDVDSDDVAELISADSVGTHFNKVFKQKYGPGEHKGGIWEVEFKYVAREKAATAGTPKGLVANPDKARYGDGQPMFVDAGETKEFSLQSPEATVNREPVYLDDVEPTREYSLSFEDEAPEVEAVEGIEGVREIVVHFTLNDYDRKFKYTATEAVTVEDAIEELNDYVSKLGAKGRVRKVVVKFD